jgi:hypothetical protein
MDDDPRAPAHPRADGESPDAAPAPARLVVRLLDELAGHATAPALVRPLDGWQLRVTPDAPFRRANSVLPNGDLDAGTDLDDAIDTVEEFYAERYAPARFQLSDAARPAQLDRVSSSAATRSRRR